jgi:hypothetical protein
VARTCIPTAGSRLSLGPCVSLKIFPSLNTCSLNRLPMQSGSPGCFARASGTCRIRLPAPH